MLANRSFNPHASSIRAKVPTPAPLPLVLSVPDMSTRDSNPSAEAPLWTLLARLLPPKIAGVEFYTPRELALVCGVGSPAILHHCRDLFPAHEGHYRLSRVQAEIVLARYCAVGRNLPSRQSIEARLKRQAPQGGVQ